MKFNYALKTVSIDVSIAELQAIVSMIGPTSENSRVDAGMSRSNSILLGQIYNAIDNFLNTPPSEREEV